MDELLYNKTEWNLIARTNDKSNIVIGAPHHAIGGVTKLPCPTHEVSDENTGLIAKAISDVLESNLIIACNARVDPNKSLTTEYSQKIINWGPKYLIEIHGHGAKAIEDEKIEISSGKKNNKYSMQFSKLLQRKFEAVDDLKHYKVIGDYNSIYFRASNTSTINDSRWISFHIELPPSLRLDEKNELPDKTRQLINLIVETAKEVCI